MICRDGSVIVSFLCYHRSKQRNRNIHGGNESRGSKGRIRVILLYFLSTPVFPSYNSFMTIRDSGKEFVIIHFL